MQAAKAKHKELRQKFPEAKIICKDVMIDWLPKVVGKFFTGLWNHAQRTGNMMLLEICVSGQRFADKLIWIPVFCSALSTLLKENVDCVVDTQLLGTSAILKAIRLIHRWKGKKIILEKVITDLPTESANHFFHPIKKLSEKDKKFLRIITTTPLLEDHYPNADAFWNKNCNITNKEVHYDALPIRPSFIQYAKQKQIPDTLTLNIATHDPKETHLIHRVLSFGTGNAKRMKNSIAYTIHPEDKVAMLMLGANPHEEAVLEYIKHFINILRERKYKTRKDHLFVCCSKADRVKILTQEKIVQLLKATQGYPKSLTIIPIPYQEDEVIAPLFHRCNATITRAGGLTSMELLTVSHGTIWIHKGSVPKLLPRFFLKGKTIQEGMPPWEKGNAKYLQAKKGARFITPQTFNEVTHLYFPEETEIPLTTSTSSAKDHPLLMK